MKTLRMEKTRNKCELIESLEFVEIHRSQLGLGVVASTMGNDARIILVDPDGTVLRDQVVDTHGADLRSAVDLLWQHVNNSFRRPW